MHVHDGVHHGDAGRPEEPEDSAAGETNRNRETNRTQGPNVDLRNVKVPFEHTNTERFDEGTYEPDDDISPYDFLIPYNASEDDDDDAFSLPDDPRFVDSGWGGECLQDSEDIDFDFVYALHTFVATVEGQANATKGDTMVLLDDSNSYWWLVRVVKDSSIGKMGKECFTMSQRLTTSVGYLPAEHIETPTERLARLNKHRNIDVCDPRIQPRQS
jgi:hypothetical protein